MVFQKPNPFPKSIYENVAFGPRLTGYSGSMDDLVESSLRKAFLWDEVKDKLKESGFSLSGGQQQRLCIARAIAVDPEVILMDEPCSALDPIATLRIEDLMHEMKEEYTIVIVTHNMQQAARVSDKTAFLTIDIDDHAGERTGTLVEFDATDKIFSKASDRAPRTTFPGASDDRSLLRSRSPPVYFPYTSRDFDEYVGRRLTRRNSGRRPHAAKEGITRVSNKYSKTAALAATLAAAALILSACAGAGRPDRNPRLKPAGLSGAVVIDGSSTVAPNTEVAAEFFGEEHPDVRVSVGVSGTGGGFEKFCNGETDISEASRPIKDEEAAACEANGITFVELGVANDGLAVVVNPENDFAQCLTVDEVVVDVACG